MKPARTSDPWWWLRVLQAVLVVEIAATGIAAISSDDGVYIAAGHLASQGLQPIVDFAHSQGPLLPYLLAPFFLLFGPSLLTSRLFGIAFTLALYFSSLRVADRWFRRDFRGDPGPLLPILLTGFFILYPELLGALSRVGTKESLASLLCLMTIAPLFFRDRPRRVDLAVSAAFLALLIGLKFTLAMLLPPVLLYVAFFFSFSDALLYLALTGVFTVTLYAPYFLPGKAEFLLKNFYATKISLKGDSPGLWHVLHEVPVAAAAFLRAAAKLQLVGLAALAGLVYDWRREGAHKTLVKSHHAGLFLGIFLATAHCLMVSAAMHRIYMVLPLLFLAAAISMARMWHEARKEFLLPTIMHPAPALLLLAAATIANSAFLFRWGYTDTGFTTPSFEPVRAWLQGCRSDSPLSRLRELASPGEEFLYIGDLHDRVLARGLKLSPLSAQACNLLMVGSSFGPTEAERYKFLTQELLYESLSSGRWRLVTVSRWIPTEGIDSRGIDWGAIHRTLESRYALVRADRDTALYLRK